MKPKSPFVMSKTDRNGILIFISLLVFLCLAIYKLNHEIKVDESFSLNEQAQERMDVLLDSLKKEQNKVYVPKIYPFNPNFISDEKSYRLEMTPEQFDKLQAFRKADQWINSPKDFQNVTGVSDEWMSQYATYFKFPDWVIKQQAQQKARKISEPKSLSFAAKKDLNKVTQEELMAISGIGEKLSQRILRYKTKIGGFRDDIQLKDIYGLSAEVRAKVLAQMTVKSGRDSKLIDINQASLIELTEVPYFDYELAREIYTFIKLREGIQSFEELSKIQRFKAYQIPQLKLYLKINKNE